MASIVIEVVKIKQKIPLFWLKYAFIACIGGVCCIIAHKAVKQGNG